VYIDPEASEARAIEAAMHWSRGQRIAGLAGTSLSRLREQVAEASDREHAERFCHEVVVTLVSDARATPELDPRVRGVLDALRVAPDRRASIAQVAGAVSLSAGRLAHLFKQEVGVPIRRYLLWLRLGDALSEMSTGRSLTEAAHAAGFADSSHLTRTFRRMLGLPPSALLLR